MKLLARRELVPAVMVVIAFAIGPAMSPHFLDARYLMDAVSQQAEAGLLALGMTLVIVSGQIDLSVAATLALVAGVTAKLMSAGVPIPVAGVLGAGLGTGLGWINGAFISRLRLPSFVVTLATMAGYRGVAHVMLGAGSEPVPPKFVGLDMMTVPGTPVPVLLVVLILAAVATGIVLHRSVLGRWIYSVGTNERASLFSGVPTVGVTTRVFAVSGFFAGLAGLIIDSRLGIARYDHATGLELDVITAVVLGGASIYGGQGSILGTMLALLALSLVRTEMGLRNYGAETQLAVIGTLLIVAVLVTNLLDRLAQNGRSPVKVTT
ncbi:ABC transporter permease [Fimbriimonas ginsengisoli]|uniref:Autoinducer 2 import system permease protein LsrD n=1 Tax=Fimbriimonas ginsengisoli Gsoil 348 TaxID=661478 RepID=A0A068NRP1_FIMGI|nr:ABC transporter permease [Fimbriimonas ginsengisoli]AIE85435.1 sugar ABC transporter permease protein [Fimbriimonas ginsengisoli Gsoil 348]